MRRVLVAIPSTFTADEKRADLRTYKIGVLARVFATFAVTDVCVYYEPDPKFDSHGLGRFIVKILKYLNTPPYLRQIAFPLDDSLQWVGVCEPLKTPHHLRRAPYRYVWVLKDEGETLLVTDGTNTFTVRKRSGYKEGERVVVVDMRTRETVAKYETEEYWGFDVFYFNRPLDRLLEKLRREGWLIIGTSKYGEDVREADIRRSDKVAVIFGGPFRGIREILGDKWSRYRGYFDYFLNFVPNQTVETIRLEEAVHYVLAVLRFLGVV